MANTKPMGKAFAISTVISALGVAIPYNAMAADTLEGALKESTAKMSLRPRWENVTLDTPAGATSHSDAFTLKTRLTFTTGSFFDVSALVEFDDVTSLKDVDYLDGTNGLTGPAIVDPEGTEVNQAYLAYAGLPDTTFKWGRQRILLDNQRFVGGVGWRQNEQTYDSISVMNSSIPGLTAFYANVSNVNRIFGEQATPDTGLPVTNWGDHTQDTNLLNVGYAFEGIGKLSAYYYDIDNKDAAALANITYGVRFAGATELDAVKLGYELEYATQEETGDAPVEYSADYMLVSVSGTMSGFTLGIAQEVLGGDTSAEVIATGADAQKGFTTSLATLHKFQGWADVFLATPGTGIEDTYLTFKAPLPLGMSFVAMYHDFESSENVAAGTSGDFGSEIDAAITKKFDNGATLQLKYADFSAGDDYYVNDVRKTWVTATYAF